MKRSLWLAACAALPLSALAAEVAPQPQPMRVRASPVGAASAGGRTAVAAALQARERASLATRIAAKVLSVRADEGALVKKGELLVALDDADLRAQLRAAQAALDAAQAQRRRIAALVSERAATAAELDGANTAQAQAQAQVSALGAQLQYASMRAPFAGRVQARRVQAGDLVGPGQVLIELEGQGLELQATLSEDEARGLHQGAPLPFEADGRAGTAEITALAAGGDPTSHRQLLRARVLTPLDLRSGSFARLFVAGASRRAITVPRAALVERGDLTGVFVLHQGRAELRWLLLGDPEGDRVPVRAGLRSGELVIDDPASLSDGQPVEVANAR